MESRICDGCNGSCLRCRPCSFTDEDLINLVALGLNLSVRICVRLTAEAVLLRHSELWSRRSGPKLVFKHSTFIPDSEQMNQGWAHFLAHGPHWGF